jgi:hypothetical protein
MKKYTKETWTAREDELLQEYYYTLSNEALLAILPGRGRRNILDRVSYLKRKNRNFRFK